MGGKRGEPAVGRTTGGARSSTGRGALGQLRLALIAGAVALAFLMALVAAYELAAAREPQHRAALEELIRYQTGLEVRFAVLALRWGWYGPEALFQDVELGEAQDGGLRLRARRLIVSLDTWRMLRTGQLEARRITLEDPSVDLAGGPSLRSGAARPGSVQLRDAGARILSRWRGGEIQVSGGTVRLLLPASADAVNVAIADASLRRLGEDWSGEAQMVLPQPLGASLHVRLQLRARADLRDISSATVSVEGRQLELAAWTALAGLDGQSALPRSGRADLRLEARFLQGRLRAASGHIAAQSLQWSRTAGSDAGPSLGSLRGSWQLRRRGAAWHLSVDALELEPDAAHRGVSMSFASSSRRGPPPDASLVLDFVPDGSQASGRARHAPLGPLLSLLRSHVPQLPSADDVRLRGEASEVSFLWNAHRVPGTRLSASAEFQDVAVAQNSGEVELSGLSGRLAATEGSVALTLHAPQASLARPAAAPLEHLNIEGHLEGAVGPSGDWQIETHDLGVRREGLNLNAKGLLELTREGSAGLMNARVSVTDTEATVLAGLIGPRALSACGAIATRLEKGRLASGELLWRGPFHDPPWSSTGTRFEGSLLLEGAQLHQSDDWPPVTDLSAHIDWHGARFRARIVRARTQGLTIEDARADWDARTDHAARLAGRLSGDAGELLGWLQSHRQVAAWAPRLEQLEQLELRGRTVLDLELSLPGSPARGLGAARPYVHMAALLDGVQMRPVPGVPPLEDLRGVLSFADGRLQHSIVTARWLGGPASLTLAERREQGLSVLTISGRGVIDGPTALHAAAGNVDQEGLDGRADWSALLTIVPGAAPAHWQLHADSSLSGIASHLPQPFDKASRSVLPLHVDWEARNEEAQLRLVLGTRLAAVAALARSGETWRIERGAVRLGGGAPAVPVEPVMLLDGRLAQLDLAAGLALMRQAARDAALPRLRGRVIAGELRAGDRRFPEAFLTAESVAGAGALELESSALSGSARWPALADADHPALLHIARLNITQPGDASIVLEAAAALAPAAQLAVDELQWQGRTLGSLSAALALAGQSLESSHLVLSSAHAQAGGSARCRGTDCTLTFSFDTRDGPAALTDFGLAPELSAREAHVEGELRWPTGTAPSLASLHGSLHMQLTDGTMGATIYGGGERLALLSVPALLAGLGAGSGQPPTPEPLRFVQFSADYALHDGQAVTSDLHFDGDAEILVRGRVGLLSGEYDERAWILRGEDRLPVPLRRLGPGPGVAAVWLSLRDLLGAAGGERSRAALHLRGTWSDPIVIPE